MRPISTKKIGSDLAKRIEEALGIRNVTKFEFRSEVNSVLEISIDFMPDEIQARNLLRLYADGGFDTRVLSEEGEK